MQVHRCPPDLHGALAQGSAARVAPGNESDGEAAAGGHDDELPEDAKDAGDRICIDMDFAENYEIVHKIEIQSENWAHQQVTLYIVMAHFKNGGSWKSEAHVFVSGDRSHDTYFVQHAMAGVFHLCSGVCVCVCIYISSLCLSLSLSLCACVYSLACFCVVCI